MARSDENSPGVIGFANIQELGQKIRENDGNKIAQLKNESSTSENDSHLRDDDIQAISQSGILMTDSDNSICAFCHSSKISEVSGPMLNYSSGNMVVGDEATHPSDVIHVHIVCIDWKLRNQSPSDL